ncbi:MAG: hypothetical protein AAF655_18395, partial [Bacteroidota bacterium]
MRIYISLILLLLLSTFQLVAQSDEINISAAFSTFIDLKIVGNANVDWIISTISNYENGFAPSKNLVTFQVSSSNNFSVAMSMTPMSDGNGNEVDLRNIAVRLFVPEARAVEEGVRWDFAPGDYYSKGSSGGWRKSAMWTPTSSDKTILLPGSHGNAGGYVENEFLLALGLGTKTAVDNLP